MRSKLVVVWIVLLSQVPSSSSSECRADGLPTPLSPDIFGIYSCSVCYLLITSQSPNLTKPGTAFRRMHEKTFRLVDSSNKEWEPDPASTEPGSPADSIRSSFTRQQWTECCNKAIKCCQEMQSKTTDIHVPQCSMVWNFYGCWPPMKAKESTSVSCPDYYYAYQAKSPCPRYHRRICLGNEKVDMIDRCQSLEFGRLRPELSGTGANEGETNCCRTERGYQLSLEAFKRDTCARCFDYMPDKIRTPRIKYVPSLGALNDTLSGTLFVADPEAPGAPITEVLGTGPLLQKWLDCCRNAVQCCRTMAKDNGTIPEPFCPRTWDGWSCFPDTPGGDIANQLCPDYIYFSHSVHPSCRDLVEKKCETSGNWFKKISPGSPTREYTNYLTCGNPEVFEDTEYFLIACLVISMVALIPALIIFVSYRQLRVVRVKMHLNFFLALLLNAFLTLLYRCVLILPELSPDASNKETTLAQNGAGCKILFVLSRYFRMCTYTWMLCEGFYLQRLITAAFAEQKKLIWFYLVGWVFPVFPVLAFAITRAVVDDEQCWTDVTPYEWILASVNLSCIFLNLIFLVNIIRVLVTKLRSIQSNEPLHYRKAVRATLVLIPLFGVHFILAIYHGGNMDSACTALIVYNYFQVAIDGLQGFCVAILFCYMNGEVIYLLKRSYERFKINQGFPPRVLTSRLSTSTQMSAIPDNHTPYRGTPPPAKVHVDRNGSIPMTFLRTRTRTDSDRNHTDTKGTDVNANGLTQYSEEPLACTEVRNSSEDEGRLHNRNDGGLDTSKGVGLDSSEVVGLDSSNDIKQDSSIDARLDSNKNVGLDSGKDVGLDSSRDVGLDSRKEVGRGSSRMDSRTYISNAQSGSTESTENLHRDNLDHRGFGYDNVTLDNEKVTEL